jgi:hypothetical protein
VAKPHEQQEPVDTDAVRALQKATQATRELIGLHTSPPASKPWAGLTDEQRHAYDYLGPDMYDVISKTEAKLREKNA